MSTHIDDGAAGWAGAQARRRVGTGQRARLAERALVWFALCAGGLLMMVPFLWMVSTSLSGLPGR